MSPFSPPPALASRVLDACTDPALSLREVAATFHTTVEALSLWLSAPEQAERFLEIHAVAALRTQCIAVSQLAPALGALAAIAKCPSADAPQLPPDTDPLRAAVINVRRLDIIRRAATTIVHLSRRPPSLARPARPHRDSPASPVEPRPPAKPKAAPPQPPSTPDPARPPTLPARSINHAPSLSPLVRSAPSVPFARSAPSDPFPFSARNRSTPSRTQPAHLLAAAGAVSEHWP